MELVVRQLPHLQDYLACWQSMQNWVAAAHSARDTYAINDEIWLLQHPPVFTQGQAGRPEHVLAAHDIPVVQVDRGGQVTYHGPGQLVGYFLLHLNRYHLHVRGLVQAAELLIIDLLADYGVTAHTDRQRPGVYVHRPVDGRVAKIASLGFRIRHGICYHGIAVNIAMDMTPFDYINPCGYADLPMAQLQDFLSEPVEWAEVSQRLADLCQTRFSC